MCIAVGISAGAATVEISRVVSQQAKHGGMLFKGKVLPTTHKGLPSLPSAVRRLRGWRREEERGGVEEGGRERQKEGEGERERGRGRERGQLSSNRVSFISTKRSKLRGSLGAREPGSPGAPESTHWHPRKCPQLLIMAQSQ